MYENLGGESLGKKLLQNLDWPNFQSVKCHSTRLDLLSWLEMNGSGVRINGASTFSGEKSHWVGTFERRIITRTECFGLS
jgi:hypothetical protein